MVIEEVGMEREEDMENVEVVGMEREEVMVEETVEVVTMEEVNMESVLDGKGEVRLFTCLRWLWLRVEVVVATEGVGHLRV